ncbi:hypothetical protein [Bradyrhizobium sp. USDA 241]|uniref:hypothetical protein n=1 Tax=Bradyrhizobium sp. USDA 241 TaxID=3377725 RepID=UPI003C7941D9
MVAFYFNCRCCSKPVLNRKASPALNAVHAPNLRRKQRERIQVIAVPPNVSVGRNQDKQELAPGIWQVSTAGHGGIKSYAGNWVMTE